MSGESIFGALGAYVFLDERPQWHVLTGALLVFTAIMIVALSAHVPAAKLEVEQEG